MIPKVEACLDSLRAGVRKTHMIDGRLRHSLLLEIYTDRGVGTEIVLGSSREQSSLLSDAALTTGHCHDQGHDPSKPSTCSSSTSSATTRATRSAWCAAKARTSGTREGNRYLDFFPGWGCDLLGHCPPRVVEAVREQVGQLIHVPEHLVHRAAGAAGPGAERAQRLGRPVLLLQQRHRGVRGGHQAGPAQRQAGPLQDHHACSTASTAARSARSAPPASRSITRALEPLLAGFSYAPFGDLDAAAKLIDGETCAILVEPIQGEGGVNLPPAGYLEGLRELADQHKLLLIFDEVQTGMGRTGQVVRASALAACSPTS